MPQITANLTGVPVRQLSAEKEATIEASPQAQLRTARYKKAVRFMEGLVLKGPYKDNDAALINNLRFTYAIDLLETALQLPERERSALPWQFLGIAPGGYYLAASNVGLRTGIPFLMMGSRLETAARVVPRRAAVERVSDLEANGDHLTQEVKLAVLQHLYFRYLLGIGDSGTHNILKRQDSNASERLIAGIDLEEKRKVHAVNRRLDLLFKKPCSRRQVPLYAKEVCRIKPLSGLDLCTLAALRKAGIDVKKLVANMKGWHGLN